MAEIKANLSVDRSTAETCLKIVECFINANANFDICSRQKNDGTYEFQLCDTGGGEQ